VIVFRCDAGAEHGLGHLMRCRALASAVTLANGGDVKFLCQAPAGLLAGLLGQRDIPYQTARYPVGSSQDERELRDEIEGARVPHTVVLDARTVEDRYVSALHGACDLVCLDDEQYRDLECRLIVNPNPWAKSEHYGVRPGRTILAGQSLALVDGSFLDQRRDRTFLGDPPAVIVTMGGEDPDNVTAGVLRALAEVSRLRLMVVLGPAFRGQSRVLELANVSPHDVEIIEGNSDLAPLMATADAAISSASTTCYELATAGVPTILVTLADHQIPVARYFRESGCGVVLSADDDFQFAREPLQNTLVHLLEDPDARRNIQSRACEVFDGCGASHISQAVLGRPPSDSVA
jgi:UDP-2,4-diacetamido-2,4,6-trideoxy-beta-L-altropyranose hydrolase